MPESKLCPKCNTAKPTADFAKNRNFKDGLESVCKPCLKAYHQNRRLKLQRIIITEKRCLKCGIAKPVSEFYRSSIYKDGFRCSCISCERTSKANIRHIEVTEKQCNKCGIVKPISEYHINHSSIDGHIGYCNDCYVSYTTQLKERPKESITEKRCHKCNEIKPISKFSPDHIKKDGYSDYCKLCIGKFKRGEPMKRYQTEYQQTLKREVLTHYSPDGILKCADPYHVHKTPEMDIDVLTLDHINGGGSKENKETKSRLYVRVKRDNFPNKFQVLCYNCNILKKKYNHENNGGKPFNHSYEWQEKYNTKIRMEVLAHYCENGIIQCADIFHKHAEPETNINVLCIDHINGDGHKHRLENNNRSIYPILRKSNYPKGFQVLCSSCNQKKRVVFKEYGQRKKKVEQDT